MRGRTIPVVCVPVCLVVAGCGAPVGTDETGTFDDPDQLDLVDRIRASLPDDTAASFERAITAEGAVTPAGEAFVDRLTRVERLGLGQRDAVAVSVAERGSIDGDTIARLDRLLASPILFQRTAFRAGLADRSGDGVLDGEARAFGLAPSQAPLGSPPWRARSGTTGITPRRSRTSSAWPTCTGTTSAGPRPTQSAASRPWRPAGRSDPPSDARLDDSSGDGLLDGMAEELGLPAAEQHEAVVGVARPLAAHGYNTAGSGVSRPGRGVVDVQGPPVRELRPGDDLGTLRTGGREWAHYRGGTLADRQR